MSRLPIRATRRETHDVACPYCMHVFDALQAEQVEKTKFDGVKKFSGSAKCPECDEEIDYEYSA